MCLKLAFANNWQCIGRGSLSVTGVTLDGGWAGGPCGKLCQHPGAQGPIRSVHALSTEVPRDPHTVGANGHEIQGL